MNLFFRFLVTARHGAPHSSGWAHGINCKECRVCAYLDGLFVATPVKIHQNIEQVGVLGLLHKSGFDEALRHVEFQRTGELEWYVGHLMRWSSSVWDTASMHAVPVLY